MAMATTQRHLDWVPRSVAMSVTSMLLLPEWLDLSRNNLK